MKFFLILNILMIFSSQVFSEEALWFRSNASAMAIDRIGEYRKDEYEWILKIEEVPGEEKRILFRNNETYSEKTLFREEGEIVKTVEVQDQIRTETEYEDGIIRTETVYDKDSVRRSEYIYRGDKVDRIEVYLEDELLYQDKYYLDGRGRLIRVNRIFPDEKKISARYGYSGSELIHEWYYGNGTEELLKIEAGEVVSRENRIDGELDYIETWEIIDGEPTLRVLYPGENREILRQFDEQERLLLETIIENEEKEIISYFYNDEDLTGKIIRGKGRKERWEYEWRDGEVFSETVYINMKIVKKYIYPEKNARWEITYRNGEVLATVKYENDIPVQTVFGEEPENGNSENTREPEADS